MKMKGKHLPAVVLILALALAFAGCGGDSGDSGNDAAANEETTVESGGETTAAPLVIKVNSFLTEGSPLTEGTKIAVEAISEFSNGELLGEGYYNGSLLGFDDSWEGCGTGTVDVAFIPPAVIGQYSRLLDGLSLPIEGLSPDPNNTTKAFNEVVNTREEFAKDLEKHNLKVLYVEGVPGNNIHMTKTLITKPEDMKGIVIEALGKNNSDFFGSIGAQTVTLDFGEYMLSAQRGVVDGFFNQFGAMQTTQSFEVLTKHTIFGTSTDEFPGGSGFSSSPMIYVVNLNTWNNLTESQQEALVQAFQKGVEAVVPLDYPMIKAGYDLVKERGDEIVQLDAAAQAHWFEAAQPIIADWESEMNEQGYDGAAVYDALKATVAKYQ